jgi:predicted transcriptional regulator
MQSLYDLLFEVSNDFRYQIINLLNRKPMKISQISNQLNQTMQEVSRNANRLSENGLIYKDNNGFFHLTHYGEIIHILLYEMLFVSKHREYFITHTVKGISTEYITRLGELSGGKCIKNVMEFLYNVKEIIDDSKEHVWLLVDQYPLNLLSSTIEAIDRQVSFRILDENQNIIDDYIYPDSLAEKKTLAQYINAPQLEHRTIKKSGIFLILSENKCALAFPLDGISFDYQGFIASDKRSMTWSEAIFQHYWNSSHPQFANHIDDVLDFNKNQPIINA